MTATQGESPTSGAGPVGSTLALAIAGADLDVVVLDARAEGEILRRKPVEGRRKLAQPFAHRHVERGQRLRPDDAGLLEAVAAFGIDPATIVYNHLKQPRELVKAAAVAKLFA